MLLRQIFHHCAPLFSFNYYQLGVGLDSVRKARFERDLQRNIGAVAKPLIDAAGDNGHCSIYSASIQCNAGKQSKRFECDSLNG